MLNPFIESSYNFNFEIMYYKKANKTKGEIRDHRYTQQKRLGHERAINKYTSKLQEKDTTTNFITNVIYYNTKKLQINLILKVSSPE